MPKHNGFDPLVQPNTQDPFRESLRTWTRMVFQFTERDLTIATDRLPAMSGLIAYFKRRLAWTNVSGLWKEHLPKELLWSVPSSDNKSDRPDNNAPTWSWISVKSRVGYSRDPLLETQELFVNIQFDELNPSVINVHGPLLGFKPTNLGEAGSRFVLPIISPGTRTPRNVKVAWDTIETHFASLFFAPLLWTTDAVDGSLEGLCIVPDDFVPSTYQRCGYINLLVPKDLSGSSPYLERKEEFRIV
jgi:hypothetical protein